MEEMYYLLDKETVGKRTADGDFLYSYGQWIPDIKHEIADCLIGYDSSEETDSPYAIGNTEMLSRIESITNEQVEQYLDSCHNNTKEQNTEELKKKPGLK
jgi:hypothetical protein